MPSGCPQEHLRLHLPLPQLQRPRLRRQQQRLQPLQRRPRQLRRQRPRRQLQATATVAPSPTPTPTSTPVPTPAAPQALKATNVTAISFTANWSSVNGATGYRLDVSTSSTFANFVPGYQNLDVGGTTSRNITGLAPNTNYYYRLRAYNGNGTSPNSNVIRVKTRPH